ncbi:hypothetical protein NFI96_023014 [Prochilodus magdalenae]|nr:hypothetical protein NFI96_023014 [Prochilodus magdalenae]
MAGSNKAVVKYLNQDYETLKAQCLSKKELFSDPTFPAAPESLGFSELGPNSDEAKGVVWKRPKDIIPNPEFICHGATRADINQGQLGDCWLMAAIASLTLDQDILAQVIHPEQSFTKEYAGIFHFQLWQYGQWVDVVVDDRLPTRNGNLVFVHSHERNEFWSALLEKAYAKVNGSYEALSGGWAAEAFEDFTGGITERYELSKAPPNLFQLMKQALGHRSLLCTTIYGRSNEKEKETKEHLIKLHVYSITGAEEVHVNGCLVQLVRLRNPWGHKEWDGPWSDSSKEWDTVLPQEKAKLNYNANDGEFWMAYSDYKAQYSVVEICNLTPEASSSDHAAQWALKQFEGSWKRGSTAGGSNKNAATFDSNSQFVINLDSKAHGDVNSCCVLVGVMQKDMRKEKKLGHASNDICFAVYPVPKEYKGRKDIRLSREQLSPVKAVVTSDHSTRREVCQRFRLPPGDYVIIPSTCEPNQEGSFLLRVLRPSEMAGSNKAVVKYLNQDYETLKAQCLSKKELFSDPTFPAAPESLGFNKLGPNSNEAKGLVWKRPKEIIQNPNFIVQGATKADINQGHLGDCWLMAAIASLTLDPDILARVIYPEQSFQEKYAGIFHFQLWQYGQWVDVVIDDLLPTKNGQLVFVHSREKNEFWSALLEKAYAKVNGSYEALAGGWAGDGFEDFTGGIAERHDLNKAPANLFQIMKKALSRGSLLSTSISGNANETEAETKEELVKKHAYSITAAEEVHVGGSLVQLVRLRNPWGHKEWNGAWSDNSKEWDQVLPQEKAKLNYSADDGEFWMAYTDYVQRYSKVDICNLTPDLPSSDHVGQWALQQFDGSWKSGSTAGGSSKNTGILHEPFKNPEATFSSNPQFVINLEHQGKGHSCSVLVGLMQKDVRKEKKLGRDFNNICFAVYPFQGHKDGRLSREQLSSVKAVVTSDTRGMREVCQRFDLPPGQYVIIPSTSEPNRDGSFLLRVFSDK